MRSFNQLPARLPLLLAAATLAAIFAGCGGSSSHPAAPSARSAPLESIFEADRQLLADPVGTLELMRRLGVDRTRLFVPWGALPGRSSIAPDPNSRTAPKGFHAADPKAYPASGWAVYDAVDRAAAAKGIGLDFTLSAPAPVWATQPGEPRGPIGVWKPSAAAFGQFVRAVGARYSGHYPDPLHPGQFLPRINFWAIWNEPNLGIYLAPQAIDSGKLEVSPRYYRGLVDAAWSALQATGHGRATILVGELAPQGSTVGPVPGNFDMMAPLRFLRALYCVDSSYQPLRGLAASQRGCPASAAGSARFKAQHAALFHATGVADHPYTVGLAPNQAAPMEPDYAEFADLPHLESTLDRLQQVYSSHTRFPIYNTEFGYQTDPPLKLLKGLAPQKAADYMNWAEYLSWRNARLRSYDQYLLVDASNGTFPTGLQFADGTPKPSFGAYRMPLYLPVTSGVHDHQLEVWGCVRPAPQAWRDTHRTQRVEIQWSRGSAGAFRTISTVTLAPGARYFDVLQNFPGSGGVRLRWAYPHGETVFSRVVGITLR